MGKHHSKHAAHAEPAIREPTSTASSRPSAPQQSRSTLVKTKSARYAPAKPAAPARPAAPTHNGKGARVRLGTLDGTQHTYFCGAKLASGKCAAGEPQCTDCAALQAELRASGESPCTMMQVSVRAHVSDVGARNASRLPLQTLRERLLKGGAMPRPAMGTRAKIVKAAAGHHAPFVGMEGEITAYMLSKDLQGGNVRMDMTLQFYVSFPPSEGETEPDGRFFNAACCTFLRGGAYLSLDEWAQAETSGDVASYLESLAEGELRARAAAEWRLALVRGTPQLRCDVCAAEVERDKHAYSCGVCSSCLLCCDCHAHAVERMDASAALRGALGALAPLPSLRSASAQQRTEQLQALVVALSRASGAAQRSLASCSERSKEATRTGYLTTIHEIIGPKPQRPWRDEWRELEVASQRSPVQTADFHLGRLAWMVDWKLARGWPEPAAAAYTALSLRAAPIAAALRERSGRFGASTYALSEALAARAALMGPDDCAPPVYTHLSGRRWSLAQCDDRWLRLEEPDNTGFKGFTCSSQFGGSDDPRVFADASGYSQSMTATSSHAAAAQAAIAKERGDRAGDAAAPAAAAEGDGWRKDQAFSDNPGEASSQGGGAATVWEVQDSDVVCIVSKPRDRSGFHSAVQVGPHKYDLPPNTLVTLVSVQEGPFEALGATVRRRLLTVSVTFQFPADTGAGEADGKFAGNARALSYADRAAYVRGMFDIVGTPLLTMEQEWSRGDVWTDYRGAEHTDVDEWAYVTGAAGGQGAERDANNVGMRPEDFAKRCNEALQERALALPAFPLAELELLTAAEVLALRLYTGAPFQPINEWLRNIGRLDAALRRRMARDPAMTYAATVGHICSAIRKLVRVNSDAENGSTLYRGVRGILPNTFWLPDAAGLICATDLGLMSTSCEMATPVRYMAAGTDNVLWCLQCGPEDDSGFHCGADVSMLSQYAGEKEVLFPPLCMLQVLERADAAADGRPAAPKPKLDGTVAGEAEAPGRTRAVSLAALAQERLMVSSSSEAGKTFTRITVRPCFV